MAQIGDFFARLVSAGGTRGLSGDADRVLPAEPVFAFFNDRLRKHHTAEDFVADPSLLWSTQTFLARRGGLEAHLRAERGDGVAGFSDILIVVNPHDWRRSLRLLAEPWAAVAAHRMRTRFRTYCEEHDFHRLFPQRPMGVRVVEDGGLEMGGAAIGLGKGEFVTGLLPNFYAGAHATSRPVVAFHLNIPGAWVGYREVGRLYSDQVLFTLGSHWLDNYQHPRLQLPALYRLQQFSDGSFIHVINPEAIRDVLIQEHVSNGATVLTLQHVSGVPLAHLVLAMLDADSSQTEPGAGAWTGASRADDDIDLDEPEDPSGRSAPDVPVTFQQSRTVVPADVGAKLLTLRERGVLLQRVHFARFMTGYDVFIGPGGEVGTALEAPSATLQVRRRAVSVVAHVAGVALGNQPLTPGRPVPLSGNCTLTVGPTRLDLRDLSTVDLPHWPYLLEIRRPGNSSHLVFGRSHRVGRDPRCSVRLPDEPHNGNIVWRAEVASSSVIRSRNGEIPKSRFYIDSIMVASEHAEIDLTTEPRLRGRARDCYCYVRRDDELMAIVPKRMAAGRREFGLHPRDELLIGNCVFQVGWAEGQLSIEPEPLTAELLAAAVDELQTEDRPPMPEVARSPDVFDAPVAGGLGERGPSPQRIEMPPPPSADSLLPGPPVRTAPSPQQAPPRVGPPMMAFTEPPPADSEPAVPPRRIGPPMMPLTEPPPPPLSSGDDEEAPLPPPPPPLLPPPAGPPPAMVAPPMMDATEPPSAPLKASLPDSAGPAHSTPAILGDITDSIDPLDDVQLPVAQFPPPLEESPPLVAASAPPAPVHLATSPSSPPSAPSVHDIPDSLPTVTAGPRPPERSSAIEVETVPVVAIVDEENWQLELGRPARLVTAGWMVAGKVTIGNHFGCDVVLPENRVESAQNFSPLTIAQLKVRGTRGHVRLLAPSHATLMQHGTVTELADSLEEVFLRVPRLDADGDEDFCIELSLVPDPGLPDPRAQMLTLDRSDPMVAGLFTLGVPLNTPHSVQLGPISASILWDGSTLHVGQYLDSYRRPDGSFHPFFHRASSGRFSTVPEDGRAFRLSPGDTLLAGSTWIVVETANS